nr:DsbE family thiol:disulfide interchange protein [Oceanococcus sp. HetDA_MAG_MS8]
MRYLWGLPIIAVGAMIWVLAQGLKLDPSEIESPLLNQAAPDFASTRLHDGLTTSLEDLRGEVTLLNVWASWCVACRQEHPLLNDMARANVVRIVGLNYKDTPEQAKDWLARLGNPYAWSVVDQSGRIGIDYGVYGVPETFVLDQQGVIRAKRIGPITPDYLEQQLLPLLDQLRAEQG